MEKAMELKPEMNQKLFRTLNIDRADGQNEDKTIELAFSSETAVERPWGVEILDHSTGAVNLERLKDGAPLLLGHDPEKQIGVVENARIDPDKVGRAKVRFSKGALGQEIFNDVKDGIRRKVSVGYKIIEAVVDELLSSPDKQVLRVRWEPLEISIVAIPADVKVGIGRSQDADETTVEPIPEVEVPEVEIREEIKPEADILPEPQKSEETKAEPVVEERQEQSIHIEIKEEKKMETQPMNLEVLTEKEERAYSIHRLIASQMPNSKVDAGYEREVSEHLAKQMGRNPEGLMIPLQVLFGKRDANVADNAAGGYLKGTDHRGDLFIGLLAEQLVSGKLGATILPGLVGDVSIPRSIGGTTAEWIADGSAATESSASFGAVTLSPKTLSAFCDITRKLLLQSSPAVEGIIRNDIARQIAIGIDKAVFHGTGASNDPTGICSTSGMTSGSGAIFGITSASAMEAKILGANVVSDRMAWVTTPALYSTLKARVKESGQASYLIENGNMFGYQVAFSNVVTSGYMFLGDFSECYMGFWGNSVEILVDPYSLSTSGGVRVVGLALCDVALRNYPAFTYLSSVS